ncbi:AI-2E family transporter [Leptolyngbya sp. FACHB-17]|uniref:AI-2E family transporter n=1 Tax=unclassified Leptolyngbya TaxID=2650499 RepID=UPI0016801473|nr:AI-2E family transporter [Leptolyngbya sp. FACHB-17]
MGLGRWIGFLAFAIALYILWELRQVLLLVFAAVVFATALSSLVKSLQRFGLKRGGAVLISIVTLLVLTALFIGLIVPPFITQFQQLVELVPRGLDRVQSWFDQMQQMVPGYSQYMPGVDDLVRQIQPLATRVVGNFFALFSNALTVLLNILLVLILTIMLLINPQPYRQGFIALFPSFYRRRADRILSLCEVSLVNWIIGILINMVVIGLVSGISLLILGVPLVLANALLAGLLEAIPNVGPVLSVIPPIAVALLDAPWKAVAVLIVYILIQQLEQYLLVPFVMSRQVALLPAVTLISQVVFAIAFGFLGLFLAIPLVIVGQIWIRETLVHDVLDRWRKDELEAELIDAETDLQQLSEAKVGIDSPEETHSDEEGSR